MDEQFSPTMQADMPRKPYDQQYKTQEHLLTAKPAPDGLAALLDPKSAPTGLGSLLDPRRAPDGRDRFLIPGVHLTGGIAYGLGSLKLAQTQGINKTALSLGVNSNMLERWNREFETSTNQGRPRWRLKPNLDAGSAHRFRDVRAGLESCRR